MRWFKEFWVHVKCVQFCKEAENDELATLNLKCGYNARVGAPTPTFLSRSIWAAWSPLLPISSHLSQKNEEHKTHAQTQTNTNRHKNTSTYIWAAWSPSLPSLHIYHKKTKNTKHTYKHKLTQTDIKPKSTYNVYIWATWSPSLPSLHIYHKKNEEHKTHAQTQTDIKHTSTYIWAAWSLMLPHLYTLNTK